MPARARRVPSLAAVACGVLAVMLAVEGGARLVHAGTRWLPDPRARADGYAGATWTRDYFRELRAIELGWQPYVYWRHKPFNGRHLSIGGDGLRPTWHDASGTPAGPRVFALGGSTVWGLGARDGATWPSAVARGLATAGAPADVINLGEHGYVTAQDLLVLVERLERGDVPALAIFYGGASDVFAAVQSGRPGLPQNEANREAEFNITQPSAAGGIRRVLFAGLTRMTAGLRAQQEPPRGAELAEQVARHYVSRVRAARALAREHGFRAQFVWQPIVHSKTSRTPYEERQSQRFAALMPLYEDVRARIASDPAIAGAGDWVDLSAVFGADPAPLFIDAFHLTEEGYARVAAALVPIATRALAAPRSSGL